MTHPGWPGSGRAESAQAKCKEDPAERMFLPLFFQKISCIAVTNLEFTIL